MAADSCLVFSPQIWAAVDGDSNLVEQAALARHLRGCTACQKTLRQAVRTNRRLAEHALVPFGIGALASNSSAGGTSAVHRARPRPAPRRASKTSSSATPLIATGIGLLGIGLVALTVLSRPVRTPSVAAEPEVTAMPEKAPVAQSLPPAFALRLGKDSPATVADGKILRWGLATAGERAPTERHIDGLLALCLDGQTQCMQAKLADADLTAGFALYAVVQATTQQNDTRIAALMGPAGEVAALLWSPQGPVVWWPQAGLRLLHPQEQNQFDRSVIGWRCTADGSHTVVAHGGTPISGSLPRSALSSVSAVRTLAIAHGDGRFFQGNIFAIEVTAPAPTTHEMRTRMQTLAFDYAIDVPRPASLP